MEEIKTEKITGQVEIPKELMEEIKREVKNIPEFQNKLKMHLAHRVTEVIQVILTSAFYLEVSDVHIEPKEDTTLLRIRIDGVLQDVLRFSKTIYRALLSRIKLLSGLKLNVTWRPQDGRFSILFPEEEVSRLTKAELKYYSVEVRTSSIPAEYGESIVMRILNPRWVVSMEELGLREDMLEVFEKETQKPNGMIICTGPSGAGKTTTLYAFLQKINNPGIKIITIEDPIEYHLKGVSQTQVNEARGYTFANGLRAIVRQDPDVILVGEIRDLETAQIALQAALTGHLVLTTLHTNDAAGTVARLQALGEKPTNIAPALNIAIGQRLVRRVCQKCLEFKEISPEILSKFKEELQRLPKRIMPELSLKTKIPVAKGCKDCSFIGYRGRIGIFEAFLIDDEMEEFILKSPSVSALRKKAIEKGMVSMRQDGLLKVLKGITTIEEVERVTKE